MVNFESLGIEEQINKKRLENIMKQSDIHMLDENENLDLSENFASDWAIKRKNRKRCIIYPEDKIKKRIDIIISICLLVTAFFIPLVVAFASKR